MRRRSFLRNCMLGTAAACATGAATSRLVTTFELETSTFEIQLPNLPSAFEGLTLGFLSDLHIGSTITLEWLRHCLEQLNSLQPDILIVGGDLLDAPKSSLWFNPQDCRKKPSHLCSWQEASGLFAKLYALLAEFSPRHGVLLIPGNHDHWFPPEVWQRSLKEAGLTLLLNDRWLLEHSGAWLEFVGVDDYLTGVPAFPAEASPLTSYSPDVSILLSHNPDFVGDISDQLLSSFSLALCGHTHGGQVKLPGLGPLSYNIAHRELGEGLTQRNDCQVFTSRGIGVVEVPVRIACPAEVSALRLRCT